jgi:ABC-type sugar transport system permease subunit
MRTGNSRVVSLQWFSLVLPALLAYTVFFALPASGSFYFSLTNWNGLTSRFIGLDNFARLFREQRIRISFANTLYYAVLITCLQNALGLLAALALDRKRRTVAGLRMLFFMPAVFSALVLSYVWGYLLEPNIGVINAFLRAAGLGGLARDWLGNPAWGRRMIVVVTVWQFAGYTMAIYLAGLQTIPAELFEAADIDGARALRRFRHVTFPLLAPSFTVNVVLTTIGCLKLFDQVYAMTRGGPGYTTHSVATMIFQLGFGPSSQWGYGTAMSLVLFLFILVLTSIQVSLLRRRERSL